MSRDLRMLLVFNLTVNCFGGANQSPEKIWLTNLAQPRQRGGSIWKIHLAGKLDPGEVNGCHVFWWSEWVERCREPGSGSQPS